MPTIHQSNLLRPAPCRSKPLKIRGLSYNIRRWGTDNAPPILFLHGTRDSSVTFQFIINALSQEWLVFAPDWRGHGYSQWQPGNYWFHDFVVDLDILMDKLFSRTPVPIVGHSLGGNIAGIYAGLRQDRIKGLISLDGFGPLMTRLPVDIHTLLHQSLAANRSSGNPRRYPNVEAMANRLTESNPRLDRERAMFLAVYSSRELSSGEYTWLFDPTFVGSLPTLHNIEQWIAIWSRIDKPVCWIASEDKNHAAPANHPGELQYRSNKIRNFTHIKLPDTGHNLHHDAPLSIARTIEQFFTSI